MVREALPRDEELIAKILCFLAEDDGRLEHFFATTGFDIAGVRDAVGAPLFAEALVDYVLEDDARVVAFGAFLNVPPEIVASLQGISRDSPKAQERSDRLPIPTRRIPSM